MIADLLEVENTFHSGEQDFLLNESDIVWVSILLFYIFKFKDLRMISIRPSTIGVNSRK